MINEKDFLDTIKDASGLAGMTNAAAKRIFDAIINKTREALINGEKVPFYKFGSFSVIETKERMGRNVVTGETIKIPASKKIKFTASGSLKDAIKGKQK